MPLKEGDEILVSDVEFPAAVYAWRGAAETKNLKLTFVKSTDKKFDLRELEKAISDKTKVIVVSFVQFFNGYKINLAGISELCKKHGIYFVVDGMQGVGAEPINVKELGIDILACGCQKWLFSPYGSGFFFISDSVKDKLIPQSITWYAADWQLNHTDLFKYDLPYFDTAEKFEAGYYATLNMLGMKTAIDIIADLGVENIQKHNHALIDRLASYLKETEFYEIKSSLVENERSSIVTFTCDNYKLLFKYMLENKIKAANREGSIRISVHLFNNENDIDKLIEVLVVYEKNYKSKAATGAN
ncbi:MAG: aminotransferase class V-fold PLP-dependent enzyme [candidate division Zixibacteria bacterium]